MNCDCCGPPLFPAPPDPTDECCMCGAVAPISIDVGRAMARLNRLVARAEQAEAAWKQVEQAVDAEMKRALAAELERDQVRAALRDANALICGLAELVEAACPSSSSWDGDGGLAEMVDAYEINHHLAIASCTDPTTLEER